MICVDELKPCRFRRWRQSCHLFDYADGEFVREWGLHEFAAAIGLKRSWFQGRPFFPHYDLTATKRAVAVKAGAKEVKLKDVLKERDLT